MYRLLILLVALAAGVWLVFFSRNSSNNQSTGTLEESPQVVASKNVTVYQQEQLQISNLTNHTPSPRIETTQQLAQRELAPTKNIDMGAVSKETAKRIAGVKLAFDRSRQSLGHAYRDQRGLIWGEIKRKPGETEFNDLTSLQVTFEEATRICKEEGNRLPTRSDYEHLVRDFGVRSGDGHIFDPTNEEFSEIVRRSHSGEVFPNGGYNPFRDSYGDEIYPTLTFQRVWTSTVIPGDPLKAHVFNSQFGLFQDWQIAGTKQPFLCVYDPNERAGNFKKR